MKECAKKAGKYQLLFSFYEKLAVVLADKADLGMCIKSAYDRSDRAALKRYQSECYSWNHLQSDRYEIIKRKNLDERCKAIWL